MGYFLGMIKCPKVGGPDTVAAHKGKNVGGPLPARPNGFRHLWPLGPLRRSTASFVMEMAAHVAVGPTGQTDKCQVVRDPVHP